MATVRKSLRGFALPAIVCALTLVSTAWGAQPESLSIRVHLESFQIGNADEDGALSDGDEPYLFVAVILADGTTIDADSLRNATVRILSPDRTQGNLGLNGVRARERWYSIPEATGLYDATIQPIRNVRPAQGRRLATVGIVVVAMEEDSSPRRAADAAQRALVDNLRRELEAAIRGMRVLDIDAIQDRIAARMVNAATRATLRQWWNPFGLLAGIADPDDFIGAQTLQYSYQQIQNAGAAGLSFTMDFLKTEGERVRYHLRGSVRQR